MQLVRWPGAEAPSLERSVATLGVFDGVHRGHMAVISRVLDSARQRGCSSVVVTFDRHPASVLGGEQAPSITSIEHRIRLFSRLGLDVCVVLSFTPQVAQMTADGFARVVFRDLARAELVVLGFNSRFGRGGEADVNLCAVLGKRLGFEVVSVPPVTADGLPISSTAIRQDILQGDLAHAERLLGRPFSLYGTVVPGDGRGRGLGYPTANLDLHNETVPPDGVYACRVLVDVQPLPGVVSIGLRSTFHRERFAERVVEVHIIGWEGRLYGCDLEAQFAGRLRAQATFRDADELKKQVVHDVADALRLLEGQES
jgi:riboflavin kinase/FMN adenylyltransferase